MIALRALLSEALRKASLVDSLGSIENSLANKKRFCLALFRKQESSLSFREYNSVSNPLFQNQIFLLY